MQIILLQFQYSVTSFSGNNFFYTNFKLVIDPDGEYTIELNWLFIIAIFSL